MNTNNFFDIEHIKVKDREHIINACDNCKVSSECYAYGKHIKPHNVIYGGTYFRGKYETHPLKVRYKGVK